MDYPNPCVQATFVFVFFSRLSLVCQKLLAIPRSVPFSVDWNALTLTIGSFFFISLSFYYCFFGSGRSLPPLSPSFLVIIPCSVCNFALSARLAFLSPHDQRTRNDFRFVISRIFLQFCLGSNAILFPTIACDLIVAFMCRIQCKFSSNNNFCS